MKRYLNIFFINLAIVFAFILLMEGAVRIFVKEINLAGTSSDIFEENRFKTTLGFLPNVEGYSFGKKIQTDENGFINLACTNYDKRKKSILFIGDSVTQGVGVNTDSTFVGKLSCHFQEKYNIINASLIGYDFLDYKNVVETILEEDNFGVEQVVFNFCLNDIYDKSTTSARVNSKNVFGKTLTFLKSNSYLYIWIKAKFFDRSKAYFLHDLGFYKDASDVERFQKIANDLNELCERKAIKKSIIVFPYEFQIRENKNEYLLPQEKIKMIFETQNTPVYLPQAFLEEKTENHLSLFLFGDGIHFSQLGHHFIFDFFIHEKIIE